MSGRILLSEKHGLNPSIVACPYCGKGKNEIALTGLAGEEWAKKNGIAWIDNRAYKVLKKNFEHFIAADDQADAYYTAEVY